MRERWVVKPGSKVDISSVDPGDTGALKGGRQAADAAAEPDQAALIELQARLWAESKQSVLLILQGTDASGKDGTISHVFRGINAQGTSVTSFKAPTAEELSHDFLWRVHRAVPHAGQIGIFNRSQYEDVLVARVRKLVPTAEWKRRYAAIVAFESLLAQGGTAIIKVCLLISKEEQRRRFEDRLKDPQKRWKFQRGDLEDRALWKEYQAAYSEALQRTSTKTAPWYVVPADNKWFRNWAVCRLLIETLTEMDPQYPEPADLAGITID
ncbi:MAG TPA: PPK2 family polyphosphate kinase [Candidatus Saccharimonadales bacterium]|nr:PPK2 family polyphosphate kinase [Candidatus Saccharimonadales bacterium]